MASEDEVVIDLEGVREVLLEILLVCIILSFRYCRILQMNHCYLMVIVSSVFASYPVTL